MWLTQAAAAVPEHPVLAHQHLRLGLVESALVATAEYPLPLSLIRAYETNSDGGISWK